MVSTSTILVPFHTQGMLKEIVQVGGKRNDQDIRFKEPTDPAHHVRIITGEHIGAVQDLATAKIVVGGIQVYAIRDSVGDVAHLITFSVTISAHHHWNQSERT